jgi:hypothetical protein
MISTKVFLALALTGLGAASIGTDAYLMFGKRPKIPVAQAETPRPAPPRAIQKAVSPPVAEASHEVTLEPVMVYGRVHRYVASVQPPPKQSGLRPCSDWRALGPAGRGVRTLCTE